MDRYNGSIREIIRASFLSTFYYKTKEGGYRPTWRFWRWLSVIVINIAFFISYHVDVQLLEGTMNGSRLLGFHLIDLFTAIETWTATHAIHTNMIMARKRYWYSICSSGAKASVPGPAPMES